MTLQLNSSDTVTLRHLVIVRLWLLGILVFGLALVARQLDLELPIKPLGVVIATAVLITLASWWWFTAHPAISDRGAVTAQLAIDIAVLTAILYYTGGWTNPLVSLYLVPIAVAAVTLSTLLTWLFTAACIVAYSLLTRFYVPLFHMQTGDGAGFTQHVLGMWLTFVAAGLLLAYFGTSMAATRRQQAAELAQAREQNMRNEQILGIATLAAGTAHELSTPLNSIAVIASELESTGDESTRADIRQLLAQVSICRDVLNRLRDAAVPVGVLQRTDQLVRTLQEDFTLLRPTVRLSVDCDPAAEARLLNVDNTLSQALLNLLNNAADASPEQVALHAGWREDRVVLDILDRGPGLQRRPGSEGMGIGLLLANASIERAGGSVYASHRDGGGTQVSVTLPAAGPVEVSA